jgi:hypothetical protein
MATSKATKQKEHADHSVTLTVTIPDKLQGTPELEEFLAFVKQHGGTVIADYDDDDDR